MDTLSEQQSAADDEDHYTGVIISAVAGFLVISFLLVAAKFADNVLPKNGKKPMSFRFWTTPGDYQPANMVEIRAAELPEVDSPQASELDLFIDGKLKFSDVEFLNPFGKGGFGKAYKARYQERMIAIKVVNQKGAVESGYKEPLEAYLNRNMKHPNVVRTFLHRTSDERWRDSIGESLKSFHELNTRRPSLQSGQPSTNQQFSSNMARTLENSVANAYCTVIIMEYCDKGNLAKAIQQGALFENRNDRSNAKVLDVLLTACDIAKAMDHLHSHDIIHGDLKAANVLLKECSPTEADPRGFVCKVADFGLSRSLKGGSHVDTFTQGTVSHMPPELLSDGILTPACDVYSFGILLWELMSGVPPYPEKEYNEVVLEVVGGSRPNIPETFPTSYARLVLDCWNHDHRLRPTFSSITERLEKIAGQMATFHSTTNPTLKRRFIWSNGRQEPPVPSYLELGSDVGMSMG